MNDQDQQSIDLEKRIKALEDEFDMCLREKERLYDELGISSESMVDFEAKLQSKEKEFLKEMKAKMDTEYESMDPGPGTKPARGGKRPRMRRGLRI